MPDTPDFDSIAAQIVLKGTATVRPTATGEDVEAFLLAGIVEQLRLIWNARGAADIAKLQTELSMMMGVQTAGPYVKNLDRALRTLDR